MKTDNFANQIAADMEKALNSEENQKLFSKASVIQKLAFHRVADEDKLHSETEESLKAILDINKTSQTAPAKVIDPSVGMGTWAKAIQASNFLVAILKECYSGNEFGHIPEGNAASGVALLMKQRLPQLKAAFAGLEQSLGKTASIISNMVALSEALDEEGFEKMAEHTARLVDHFIIQAAAKKDSKKDSKKSGGPKMGIKERMEKMRKMKGGKGKDSKKSDPKAKTPAKSSKTKTVSKSSPKK